LWTREIGTSSADQANAIATDSAGNIFVTGVTYGSLDGNPNLGEGDLFVAKLDAQGATLWMRQLGSTAPPALPVTVPAMSTWSVILGAASMAILRPVHMTSSW
jgi:hypothetical protein